MLGTIHRGLPPMMVAISLVVLTVVFQNCGDGFNSKPTNVLRIDSITCNPDGCESSENALIQCSFNGMTVDDGQSITAYRDSSVPFGQSCESESRTCSDGQLSGSFTEELCSPEPGQDCLIGDMTVTHGTTVVAWAEESVVAGTGTCQSEERVCDNGSVNGSFLYETCFERQPNDCVLGGQTIVNGNSITAYNLPTVPFEGTCQAEDRTCTDGGLSGSYSNVSCVTSGPADCILDGVTLGHGGTLPTFEEKIIAPGGTCTSEDQICDNGNWSGTFEYSSCDIQGTSIPREINSPVTITGDAYINSPTKVISEGSVFDSNFAFCGTTGNVINLTLSPTNDTIHVGDNFVGGGTIGLTPGVDLISMVSYRAETTAWETYCSFPSVSTNNTIMVNSTLTIKGNMTLSNVTLYVGNGGKLVVEGGAIRIGTSAENSSILMLDTGSELHLTQDNCYLGWNDQPENGDISYGMLFNAGTIYCGSQLPAQ